MPKLLLATLFLSLALMGCQRAGGDAEATATLPPLGEIIAPTPTIEGEGGEDSGFGLPPVLGENPTPEPAPSGEEVVVTPVPQDPALGARFTNLRFAVSGEGAPQANFPEGTEEVYAIWDYDGMQATDTIERVWYYNDALDVERAEAWDFLKYGFSGTVRDIYRYDYLGGLSPGRWRVELYVNGELQASGEFTVGTP